jgi:two-component system, chemotaxis family, response regulator Rcp1
VFDILLAEDNPGDVLLFREALGTCSLPCNLVIATDGEQALAILGSERNTAWKPHLIVLDVNLPKIDGEAVLRRLRKQPGFDGVPVIMLTSSAAPADRDAALDLGANLYLQKSSNLDEILGVGKIVEAILGRPEN